MVVYAASSQPQIEDLEVNVPQVLERLKLDGETIQDEYVCLCVFHAEEGSPNLEINTVTGLWHCWVCGEKGNLPRLVMRRLGAGYKDAVDIISDYSSTPDIATVRNRNLQELAAILTPVRYKFKRVNIARYLTRQSWWWKNAIPFGTFRRDTVRQFSLGYDGTSQRAVIPISHDGKWVAIMRRAVRANQQPRYLYTKGFDRRHVLYALDTVPRHESSCIVVEGAKDCLRLREYGYTGAVASLGTGLTVQQLDLIEERFDEAIIFSDNDAPGHIAQFKMASDLAERIPRVFVVQWQVARKDPNELRAATVRRMLSNKIHWSALVEPDFDPYGDNRRYPDRPHPNGGVLAYR